LPKDLAAAELFGHVRGAFSGAQLARTGIIASADRGTLLLDEIAELPLELQAMLLRVLETRMVRAVGADSERAIDVRLIAATNAPLQAWALSGRFRFDLLARLQQVTVRLPPLRERKAEILALAAEFGQRQGRGLQLSIAAAQQLLAHPWPQNVRELRNLVMRFCALAGPEQVMNSEFLAHNLDGVAPGDSVPPPADERATTTEREVSSQGRKELDPTALQERLRALGGNVAQLARELQTSRTHVYRLLNRSGIDPNSVRDPQ
jgi:DNA-binding NtrC family response regulator